jgi:predicted acyltransferase
VGCATYATVLYSVDVKGCESDTRKPDEQTPFCNGAGVVDRAVFGPNMRGAVDPDGLLSTLTAIATTYCGYAFARLFTQFRVNPVRLAVVWSVASVLLIGSGLALALVIPLNRTIWSLSFTLLTAGMAGGTLTLAYLVFSVAPSRRVKHVKTAFAPIKRLGQNPLVIFVAMAVVDIVLMNWIKLHYQGDTASLWSWIFHQVARGMPGAVASTLISVAFALVWTLVAWVMATRRIFIKL